jgi:hypothetical protein
MKKFYFSASLTFLLFFFSGLAQGQMIFVSYPGATGNWSNPLTWQLSFPAFGTAPPNPCVNCTIIINGNVTLDVGAYGGLGSPYEFNITAGGSNKITISAGATLTINTFTVEIATQTIVSAPGTVNINNEVQMFGGQVNLNGTGSIINASFGGNTDGSIYPGQPGAGIYYNRGATPPFPLTLAGSTFDASLSALGQYKSTLGVTSNFFDPYTLNCGGASQPTCTSGVVYGPANLQDIGTPPNDLIIFGSTPALPVSLLKFAATPGSGKSVNVTWTTVQEINSDYFDVERSADAVNFQSIGKVSAKGNSSGLVDYSFVDPAPVNAVNYYRLKMVDRDAKFEYSKVAKVVMDEVTNALVIYNNPFHDQVSVKVNLSIGQRLEFKLTDVSGRVMNQQTVQGQPGDNFVNIPTVSNAKGLYILTIIGQTYNQSVKLMKE